MKLYIYSDESGVFDFVNNDIFVYGGIIFLDESERNDARRRYVGVEKSIRKRIGNPNGDIARMELKATRIQTKYKQKLFQATNRYVRFGVVVYQKSILREIFLNKKSKQRYLDWAFKIGVKSAIRNLINKKAINPDDVSEMHFFQDEHSTATNGRYELKEALEQEFKTGTYNAKWDIYYAPVFRNLEDVTLRLCDSESSPLVRASDIVANKLFCFVRDHHLSELADSIHVKELP